DFAGDGSSGYLDGAAEDARFNTPAGLAIDNSGNLIVADGGNHRIRKITISGGVATAVSTIAGDGTAATRDGVGLAAAINAPAGLAIDKTNDDIYVSQSSAVRKIDKDGNVTFVAGGPWDGTGSGSPVRNETDPVVINGAAIDEIRLWAPTGLLVDANGNLLV